MSSSSMSFRLSKAPPTQCVFMFLLHWFLSSGQQHSSPNPHLAHSGRSSRRRRRTSSSKRGSRELTGVKVLKRYLSALHLLIGGWRSNVLMAVSRRNLGKLTTCSEFCYHWEALLSKQCFILHKFKPVIPNQFIGCTMGNDPVSLPVN